jgi:hypothetical protein
MAFTLFYARIVFKLKLLLSYFVMDEILPNDVLIFISKKIILNGEFTFLMVNKNLRSTMQTQLYQELKFVTHISSQRLHDLCIRASSCLPLTKMNKSTIRNRIVTYTGERIRSDTKVVLAQWNYLDSKRVFLLSNKRINSMMMSYRTKGAIWDLDVKDNFKKPPDVLFFIR